LAYPAIQRIIAIIPYKKIVIGWYIINAVTYILTFKRIKIEERTTIWQGGL